MREGSGGISFLLPSVGWRAVEASARQAGDVFGYQRFGESRRTVLTPGHTAIRQRDSVRAAHTNPRSIVRLDVGIRRSRPVIEHGSGIFGPAVEGNGHVIQRHVTDPALRRAVAADAVFGAAGDITHGQIGDRANLDGVGARNGGAGNRLAAAPPGRRLVTRYELDVAEIDPVHAAFIAQLNRQPAATRLDFAPLETDIVDVLGGFRPDLHARILGFQYAVLDRDIGRRPPLPALPRRLDHDGIVAAHDIAVADLHIAAMVRVDAIAVGHIQIVADLNAIHQHVLAPQHVQPPLRGLAEGNIADLQSLAAGEDKHCLLYTSPSPR